MTEQAEHTTTKESGSQKPAEGANGDGRNRVRVIREGVASYLPDIDPDETAEWLESFDDMLDKVLGAFEGRLPNFEFKINFKLILIKF